MWTLECPARWTGAKTPAELGLRLASVSFSSRAPDELRLETIEDPAADSLLQWKDWLVLRRAGTGFFAGNVTATPLSAEPGAEGRSYVVSGPWWWLSQVPALAPYANGSGGTTAKTGIIFEHTDGELTPRTTAHHLQDTLAAAVAAGVPIQAGSFFTGLRPLRYQAKGTSFADAIDTILQHHPDAVTWFDYSAEVEGEVVPAFHAARRASAAAVTLPFSGGDASKVALRRRDDLVPDRIRIHGWMADPFGVAGLQSGTFDLTEDPQPPVRELVLDLGSGKGGRPQPGSYSISFLAQRVRTREIPQTAAAADAREWWLDHIEALAALNGIVAAADLRVAAANGEVDLGAQRKDRVTAHKVELAPPAAAAPAPVNPNAVPPPGAVPADYPNELLEGSIEDWMNKVTARVRVTATVGIPAATVEALAAGPKAAVKAALPRRGAAAGTWLYYNTFSVEVTGTNANTGTYRAPASITASYEIASPGPAGRTLADLAADYAATLTPAPWDGSWELTQAEPGASRFLGKVLNVSGGHAAWATMRAIIQAEEIDIASGLTTLVLGPPAQTGFLGELGDAHNSIPVTLDYGYDHEPSGEDDGAAVGGFAQPVHARGAEDAPRFDSGPALLAPVHLYWEGTQARIVWSKARFAESNPDYRRDHPILFGGTAIDGETAFNLATGTTSFWLKWATTYKGVVTGDVTLHSSEPSGTFQDFIPPSPDGLAQTGLYKLKVYTIDAPAPGEPFKTYPENPVSLWQRYGWEGLNIGGGPGAVYSLTGGQSYRFRTIDGNGLTEAPAETELRTEVETVEDKIVVRAFRPSGEDHETVGEEGEPVFVDDSEAPAQFRRIADRGAYASDLCEACGESIDPQIKVVLEAGAGAPLRITGNGKCGALKWKQEFSTVTLLEWKDGLITKCGDAEFEAY